MVKSIIITALRNISRNRTFSFLNLTGLAISMSLSLLIILMLKEQYAFDNFHVDSEDVYRINTKALRKGGSTEAYASSPLPLGAALSEGYSFADEIVRLNRSLRSEVVSNGLTIPLSGFYTDPSFFEVFTFEFVSGSKKDALSNSNSIILTDKMARRLFGEKSALGQTVDLENLGEFTVSAVITRPTNTHLEFEALAPLSALRNLELNTGMTTAFNDWKNYYSSYNYIKVKPETSEQNIQEALNGIVELNYSDLQLESRDRGYEFYLQSLNEITPGPILSNNLGKGMPDLLLLFLVVLASAVMIMACLNYTQLTIAKAVTRAREIGVRKVVGARRWQVFMQFIGEAIVVSIIALVISYGLLQLMKPAVLNLHIADEFAINLQEDYLVYGLFLAFAVTIGLVAGLFPALYLSTFNPAKVLKSGQNVGLNSKLTLRKILMVFQLTLSTVFILSVFMINKQTNYLAEADYGVETENVVTVPLADVDFEQFANDVSGRSGVQRVAGISHRLGTWEDRSSDYKRNQDDELFGVRDYLVDQNYLDNLEVKFVAGRNFTSEDVTNHERFIVINEQALSTFDFSDKQEALGESIYLNDSILLQIIGITEDFHFRPLNYSIGPVIFRLRPDQVQLASIKLSTDDVENEMAAIETVWKKYDALHPFEWKLMEDEIDGAYEASGLNDITKIVGYISFLAVCIAIMGLLGMIMYNVQRRLKEIGIRKIMGASPSNIVMILNKSFLFLFLLSLVIGAPIGYQLGDLFITNYPYKANFGLPLITMAVGLILLIGIIMMTSSTLRAALTNPVKWLRHE